VSERARARARARRTVQVEVVKTMGGEGWCKGGLPSPSVSLSHSSHSSSSTYHHPSLLLLLLFLILLPPSLLSIHPSIHQTHHYHE